MVSRYENSFTLEELAVVCVYMLQRSLVRILKAICLWKEKNPQCYQHCEFCSSLGTRPIIRLSLPLCRLFSVLLYYLVLLMNNCRRTNAVITFTSTSFNRLVINSIIDNTPFGRVCLVPVAEQQFHYTLYFSIKKGSQKLGEILTEQITRVLKKTCYTIVWCLISTEWKML